jgi:hypothetical protein
VTLELTESSLALDGDGCAALLDALHRAGARLALDDFGTGYSSLGHLHCYHFDRLKIDRVFVGQLGGARSATIADSIVALGNALGVEVVAEGIETAEQLRALRARAAHSVRVGCSRVRSRSASCDRCCSATVAGSFRLLCSASRGQVSPALEDAAAFPLGTPTPHPMIDALLECVLEARFLDGARGADLSGDLDAHPIAGEERGGGLFGAISAGHPARVHDTSGSRASTPTVRRKSR